MQRRPLDDLQAELDASNAARLERIQHGANTRSLPWAERSFSNRKTGAPDAEVPAPVPQPAPLSPEEMAKRVEALGRDIAIASARLDLIEGDDDRNGDLTISDPPFEVYLSFAFYRVNDSQITVNPGALRFHGDKIITTTATTITFSGSVEWVYVEFTRGAATATVTHSSSEPSTGPGSQLVRIPLYYFEATAISWQLVKDCRLDLNFDTGM